MVCEDLIPQEPLKVQSMPYKERDSFHRHVREYLESLRPRGTMSERGVVRKKTIGKYRFYLEEAGAVLAYPSPRSVTLAQMHAIEGKVFAGSERTLAQKLSVIRAFLRWCGNKDAFKWKPSTHQRPYRGGIFLREREVGSIREKARTLGPFAELVYSLAVDNGLRCVDMTNLTLANAREFLDCGESEILGKGRDGGKKALQTFSVMTRVPMLKYLDLRREMVERTGSTSQYLLVKEVHYAGKHYLQSMRWEDFGAVAAKLNDATGLEFSMHDLRRTLGNRLWRNGVDLETIAKILRHEDTGVTFRAYIGVDADDMRAAMMKLCPDGASQESEPAERYLSTDLFQG